MKTLKLHFLLLCVAAAPLLGADDPHGTAGAKPSTEASGFKNVSVEEFDKLRANKQNRLLDVRTPSEFAGGHIPGAINIDINGPDFEKKVAGLDKKATYLMNCAGGGRSARACGKMSQLNFSTLYNLEGGFRAWEKAGKPVEK